VKPVGSTWTHVIDTDRSWYQFIKYRPIRSASLLVDEQMSLKVSFPGTLATCSAKLPSWRSKFVNINKLNKKVRLPMRSWMKATGKSPKPSVHHHCVTTSRTRKRASTEIKKVTKPSSLLHPVHHLLIHYSDRWLTLECSCVGQVGRQGAALRISSYGTVTLQGKYLTKGHGTNCGLWYIDWLSWYFDIFLWPLLPSRPLQIAFEVAIGESKPVR
jgi:hypothetical protein